MRFPALSPVRRAVKALAVGQLAAPGKALQLVIEPEGVDLVPRAGRAELRPAARPPGRARAAALAADAARAAFARAAFARAAARASTRRAARAALAGIPPAAASARAGLARTALAAFARCARGAALAGPGARRPGLAGPGAARAALASVGCACLPRLSGSFHPSAAPPVTEAPGLAGARTGCIVPGGARGTILFLGGHAASNEQPTADQHPIQSTSHAPLSPCREAERGRGQHRAPRAATVPGEVAHVSGAGAPGRHGRPGRARAAGWVRPAAGPGVGARRGRRRLDLPG